MDPDAYIKQFNVIGTDGEINCEDLSKILYSTILNNFKITISPEEYYYFKEYQERVFDLVENLRELSVDTIPSIFDYLDKVNHYLLDIVIMQWCLPRADAFLSKKLYNINYKQNIQKYNHKLIKHIDHYTIKNFCIETLIKTNNVPVHCIDYLWYYMNGLTFEFIFCNFVCGEYIGFIVEDDDKQTEIGFCFNMEFLLDLGLGQVVYENDPLSKGSLRKFLENFVTDLTIVQKMLTIPTKNNYLKQLMNISLDPPRYFGETLTILPQNVLNELK